MNAANFTSTEARLRQIARNFGSGLWCVDKPADTPRAEIREVRIKGRGRRKLVTVYAAGGQPFAEFYAEKGADAYLKMAEALDEMDS